MNHRLFAGLSRAAWAVASWLLMALVALPGGVSAREPDRVAVGTVTLLIGEARLVRADGSRPQLQRGSEVFVGDRVETAGNGHVHVAFIDRGAVSVRPDSVLEVQSYRYDPAHPEANEVRLRLERGTARSISGDALSGDKSRFRLNTPIAAVGVRGTDFIVQSGPSAVRAVVAEGAISVAPLGVGCTAEALGPCGGESARLLNAFMGRVMVEVRAGELSAHLAPALNALLPHTQLAALPQGGRQEAGLPAESVLRTQALLASLPSADPRINSNDLSAADRLGISNASPALQAVAGAGSPASGQLAWGRWSFAGESFASISVPFVQAVQGRHVTVGDLEGALFRAGAAPRISPIESIGGSYLSPISGNFDLQLTHAQAIYAVGDQTEAASVLGGSLRLNFGERRFATALALSSPTGGLSNLLVAGQIQRDGLFNVRDDKQRVSGAVTADGREAGYLFERVSDKGGVFKGRTLWGRP